MSKFRAKTTYYNCPYCERPHDVLQTVDRSGEAKALFCPHKKDIIKVLSYEWNGINIEKLVRNYIMICIDLNGIEDMSLRNIGRLAFKIAKSLQRESPVIKKASVNLFYVKRIAEMLLLSFQNNSLERTYK